MLKDILPSHTQDEANRFLEIWESKDASEESLKRMRLFAESVAYMVATMLREESVK
jgi:hypothetical protein